MESRKRSASDRSFPVYLTRRVARSRPNQAESSTPEPAPSSPSRVRPPDSVLHLQSDCCLFYCSHWAPVLATSCQEAQLISFLFRWKHLPGEPALRRFSCRELSLTLRALCFSQNLQRFESFLLKKRLYL